VLNVTHSRVFMNQKVCMNTSRRRHLCVDTWWSRYNMRNYVPSYIQTRPPMWILAHGHVSKVKNGAQTRVFRVNMSHNL